MPPTRRPSTLKFQRSRKITRRRSRLRTWTDLLEFHRTGTPVFPKNPLLSNSSPRGRQRIDNDNELNTAGGIAREHITNNVANEQLVPESDYLPPSGMENDNLLDDLRFDDDALDTPLGTLGISVDAEAEFHPIPQDVTAVATDVIPDLHKTSTFALKSSSIIALTLVSGSVRFSVQQYEIVRAILKHSNEDTQLPSYSTVRRKLFPHVLQKCFPRSEIKIFPKRSYEHNTSLRNGTASIHPYIDSPLQRTGQARVVYPTEWAKLDVSTLPYFKNIYSCNRGESQTRSDDPLSLERSLMVRQRDKIINVSQKLFVDDKYGRTASSSGDRITFQITELPEGTNAQDLSRNKYVFNITEQEVSVSAYICTSWCVGSPGHNTSSASAAQDAMHGVLKEIVLKFSIPTMTHRGDHGTHEVSRPVNHRQRYFTAAENFTEGVRTGDFCTLLRPRPELEMDELYCIIVSRFWKAYEGIPSQNVLWLRVLTSPRSQQMSSPFDFFAMQTLRGSPRKAEQVHAPQSIPTRTLSPINTGTLQDGSPYLVYRALIYCDDFKESSSSYSQSSAGGVYLLPIGMSLKARSSRTAVHVISLTPPGVSTNEVMLDIIPDIVKGAKEGVVGTMPCGQKVTIFLDIVGYIADYPAAAAPIDVLGHVGDSPCTHCNIRKFKQGGASTMGYTTNIHALNNASVRCGERHNALRRTEFSDRDANVLGMKPTSHVTDRSCPLLALQRRLSSVQSDIPLNSEGMRVVPATFDAYLSNLIAPDHLLTGLARNIIDLSFQLLKPVIRIKLDISICTALADNGLIRERSIYNGNKVQLHSTSLSTVYCVLLVSPPVLMNFLNEDDVAAKEALRLLEHLKELVAMTNWNPSVESDGEAAYNMLRIEGGRAYVASLQAMAARYVSAVDSFCRKYPAEGSVLDKPNLHRLLELYSHTIPAFGHVSHVQELVFETAHQPLKRCISRSNYQNAEVSAVEHCMGNDWQSRLALLHHFMNSPNEYDRIAAIRGLRRILMGKSIENLSTDEAGVAPFLEKIDDDIRKLFVSPLVHILKSNGNVNAALAENTSSWITTKGEAFGTGGGPSAPQWDVKSLIERGKAILLMQLSRFNGTTCPVATKWKAKRVRRSSVAGSNTTRAHDVLDCGTVVQAVIRRSERDDIILRPQGKGDSITCLFVLVGFLDGMQEGPWAVSVECARHGNGSIQTPKQVHVTKAKLLLLNESVRRVGVYHACDFNRLCSVDLHAKKIIHGESILSGGTFLVQTRKEGYPPRMA